MQWINGTVMVDTPEELLALCHEQCWDLVRHASQYHPQWFLIAGNNSLIPLMMSQEILSEIMGKNPYFRPIPSFTEKEKSYFRLTSEGVFHLHPEWEPIYAISQTGITYTVPSIMTRLRGKGDE